MFNGKKLNQWFFNISKFSENLLDELDNLSNWPNKSENYAKNWIGKSFGCEIDFKIEGSKDVKSIRCFTTRPDTLFGFSFLALSVDHPISKYFENDEKFINFRKECSKTGTTEESIAQGEKLGLKLILSLLIHLTRRKKVPVFFCKLCFDGLWFRGCFWMSGP